MIVAIVRRSTIDSTLRECEQTDDRQDRAGDQEDLVPPALVCKEKGSQHGNGSYGFAG